MNPLARLLVSGLLAAAFASAASAAQIGRDADLLRTGWYADQNGLSPTTVSSAAFGQRFSTPVTGQVQAQPLVFANTVLVVTQSNWIYGLDPVSGAVKWSRSVGTPWNASDVPYCFDIWPVVGVTSTPVIDDATGIAYFTSKSYVSGLSGAASWTMHAISVATGAEQPSFPVTISGIADNEHRQTFNATTQNQRPGLLLMNGVVYAAFGSVCDVTPFQGWVIGVSTAGAITCRWVARTGRTTSGGGIWMSGTALLSDVSGQIVLATGNGMGGGTPNSVIAGTSPPADVCESVVRLSVQPNGTLLPVDFFTPYNSLAVYDPIDADLGSGGVVGLPPPTFGTVAHPKLFVQLGKPGLLYLLDGNSLGGCQNGSGGTDAVLQEVGFEGGAWSKPAVWGGDGGWIYIASADTSLSADGSYGWLHAYQYAVNGSGLPTLTRAGTSVDRFGFGSSAPIVTSSGSTSGTAVLWIVWFPDLTGAGAELRAYDMQPVSGTMHRIFAAPIGTGSKFNPPGVYASRLYVGTRDGSVIGYGVDPAAVAVGPRTPPERTELGVAYPNPVAGSTNLELSLPAAATVRLAVYDLSGRRVRVLAEGEMDAGSRHVAWDGRDDAGGRVPPGLYLVRVDAGATHASRRVMVVR